MDLHKSGGIRHIPSARWLHRHLLTAQEWWDLGTLHSIQALEGSDFIGHKLLCPMSSNLFLPSSLFFTPASLCQSFSLASQSSLSLSNCLLITSSIPPTAFPFLHASFSFPFFSPTDRKGLDASPPPQTGTLFQWTPWPRSNSCLLCV